MANSDVTNSFSAYRPSDLCRPVRLPHEEANGRNGSSIMTVGPRVQASRHDLMVAAALLMFWFCFVLMWNEGPRPTSRSGVFSSVVSEEGGVHVFVDYFSVSAFWELPSAFPLARQLRSHLLIAKEAAALCCTCCWRPSVSSSRRCSGSVKLSCERFSIINLHSNNSHEPPVRRLAQLPHNQEVPSLIPALVLLLFACLVASAAGRLETPHPLCVCACTCYLSTKIHILPAKWGHFGWWSQLQRASWGLWCGFKV